MNIGRTMLVLLTLLLLILLVACTPGEKARLKKEAEQYLKEKYGKEFVVYKLEYSFGNKTYYMSAYPKDDPNFSFGLGKNKREKEFSDTYLLRIYERQSEEELGPLLKRIYPGIWGFETDIFFSDEIEEELLEEGIPSYLEVRKSYPEEISQDIEIYLIKDINEENKQEEIEKIWRVVQHYQGIGLKNVGLFIIYYDEELLKREEGKPDKKKRNEYHSEYFRYLFEARDLNEIETIEDVEEHLEKSRSAP